MYSCNDPDTQDLWTLTAEESALLLGMTDKGRLGFAVQLKFMEMQGRFPNTHDEIDPSAVQWLASQLKTTSEVLASYKLDGRQGQRHRRTIRVFLNFRPSTSTDLQQLIQWLCDDVLPYDPQARHGRDMAFEWYRTQRLEPPASDHLDRIIRSTVYSYETQQLATIQARLNAQHKTSIDQLFASDDSDTDEARAEIPTATTFSQLKTDPGKANLDSLLTAIAKLKRIGEISLVPKIFQDIPTKFIDQYRQRCATESIRELSRHPAAIRYSMVAMFCWRRQQQLIDALIDLLLQIIHNLSARAEKRIDKRQFAAFKRVRGKAKLLFKLAEAAVEQPDGIVKDVVYPVVGQKTLEELVAEFKAMGFDFEREVQETMRSSYGHHYRRMLLPALEALCFQSNNTVHRPVIEALDILKANQDSHQQYYDADEVALDGIVPKKWHDIVVEQDKKGNDRIIGSTMKSACYARCANAYVPRKYGWSAQIAIVIQNTIFLPADFAAKRDSYYELLKAPKDVEEFIAHIQSAMHQWLPALNTGMPSNPKVHLRQQGKNLIHLTPLDRQPEPPNTAALKREIGRRWSDVELIDIIKEVDLRVNFTATFRTSASRGALDPELLQRRFVQKETLRTAIADIVNSTFRIRNPAIWRLSQKGEYHIFNDFNVLILREKLNYFYCK